MAGKNYFEMIRDGILVDGSGGGDAPTPVLIEKSVTENGTYTASSDNADGYSSVTVDVPSDTPTLITKSISANGTYSASDDSADGYSQVSVDVPNTYSQADNGKVVLNGALVAQGSDEVTENGTVDTTLISSLLVNVSGGAGGDFAKLTPVNPSDLLTDNVFVFIPENSSYGFIFGSLVVINFGGVSDIQLNFPDQFPMNKMGTSFYGTVINCGFQSGDYLGRLTCTKGSSYITLSATSTSSGSYPWYAEMSPYILIASFNVVT